MRLLPSEWYSVSVTDVRRWLTLAVFTGFAAAGYLLFTQWQRYELQQRAIQTIDQAERLIDEVEAREDAALLRAENLVAWERLDEAREAVVQADYDGAYKGARQSLMVLKSVLQIGDRDGTIRFLFVQGGVEFRRGDRGAWKRAREQDSLDPGDWVKTSGDGTAEIVFSDNSTFILRSNTMVNLGAISGEGEGERVPPSADDATSVVFGWVELTTAGRPSTVATPKSLARVRRESEAMVTYDRDRARARYAAFSGGLEVETEDGEARSVEGLELVEQVGDDLGETRPLPGRPGIVDPAEDAEVDIDQSRRLTLAWRDAERAARYRLRVSESRLFATNLIDDVRRRTRATLGLRREGRFFWQVAAIDTQGAQGPWSPTRSFRVAALTGPGVFGDDEPPVLEVEEVQPYGSLVIVKGRTEPGARVTVNGEVASVSRNGTFNKTIQMKQEGWAGVEIVATDAAGNPSRHRARVLIDVY